VFLVICKVTRDDDRLRFFVDEDWFFWFSDVVQNYELITAASGDERRIVVPNGIVGLNSE